MDSAGTIRRGAAPTAPLFVSRTGGTEMKLTTVTATVVLWPATTSLFAAQQPKGKRTGTKHLNNVLPPSNFAGPSSQQSPKENEPQLMFLPPPGPPSRRNLRKKEAVNKIRKPRPQLMYIKYTISGCRFLVDGFSLASAQSKPQRPFSQGQVDRRRRSPNSNFWYQTPGNGI